jgi:uncharacterized membrane protein YhaH (DUF805 family)
MKREISQQKEMNWTWFLFSFKGRISRKQYWIFNLIVFIAGILLGLFTEVSNDFKELSKPQIMFMIWILWPSLAVQAKRWHDRDKSALWIFINLIPVVGPVWALVDNGFMPGTCGPNRFGPDPLEETQTMSSS